eukprot:superscaffoldBa00000311_g3689
MEPPPSIPVPSVVGAVQTAPRAQRHPSPSKHKGSIYQYVLVTFRGQCCCSWTLPAGSQKHSSVSAGVVLMEIAEVQRKVHNELEENFKRFHREVIIELEKKTEMDVKYMNATFKRYQSEHKLKQDSLERSQTDLKKLRRKSQGKHSSKYEIKENEYMETISSRQMDMQKFIADGCREALLEEKRRFCFLADKHCMFSYQISNFHEKAKEMLAVKLPSWQEKCSDITKVPDTVETMIDGLSTTPEQSPLVERYNRNNMDSAVPPPAPPIKAQISPLANMFNQEPRSSLTSSSDKNSDQGSLGEGSLSRSPSLSSGLNMARKPRVRTIFPHTAGNNDTLLSFDDGVIIALLISEEKDGWLYGELEKTRHNMGTPVRSLSVASLPEQDEEGPVLLPPPDYSDELPSRPAVTSTPSPQHTVPGAAMPVSLLWAVDVYGRVYNLSTAGQQWELCRDTQMEFKRATAAQQCCWGIACDNKIYLNVHASDLPVRYQEETYENQVWFRRGVNSHNPCGSGWISMVGEMIMINVGLNDQVWGISCEDRAVYFRQGVTSSELSGKTWKAISVPRDGDRSHSSASVNSLQSAGCYFCGEVRGQSVVSDVESDAEKGSADEASCLATSVAPESVADAPTDPSSQPTDTPKPRIPKVTSDSFISELVSDREPGKTTRAVGSASPAVLEEEVIPGEEEYLHAFINEVTILVPVLNDSKHTFAIYTPERTKQRWPIRLAAATELEMHDWLALLSVSCCDSRGIQGPPSKQAIWSITCKGDIFVSEPSPNLEAIPYPTPCNQMFWRQVGGHLRTVDCNSVGIVWGIGYDHTAWVYTGGYGGGFFQGLASSTDNIYTQTDVKSVYIYENQRWNPVTGYTNRSYHGYKTMKDFVRRRRWARKCKLATTGPWQEIPPIPLSDVTILPCAAQSSVDVVPLWGISNKGDVLCRLGVTALTPAGSSWLHVGTDQPFKSISIGAASQVWAIARDGSAFYRGSVSPQTPAGDCWYHIPSPTKQKLKQVSVGRTSVYTVDENGNLWYRQGLTPSYPQGSSWEHISNNVRKVSVGPLDQVWIIADKVQGSHGLSCGTVCHRLGVQPMEPKGQSWDYGIGGGWDHVTVRGNAMEPPRVRLPSLTDPSASAPRSPLPIRNTEVNGNAVGC